MIPLLLAADSESALRQRAARLAAWIEGSPELDLEAAALALAGAAADGERRAGVLGESREELLAGVRALAAAEPAPGIILGQAVANPEPVFLFPGQGAQWAGMGLGLRERSEAFATRLSECAAALEPHLERPLMEILESPEGDPVWRRVDCMQPALFAIALSLTELWRSFGVEPAAVVGHSLGAGA
ncbi:MAG: acyltransferase domain-containing protein, partial [Solirubrobacterales bacterium]